MVPFLECLWSWLERRTSDPVQVSAPEDEGTNCVQKPLLTSWSSKVRALLIFYFFSFDLGISSLLEECTLNTLEALLEVAIVVEVAAVAAEEALVVVAVEVAALMDHLVEVAAIVVAVIMVVAVVSEEVGFRTLRSKLIQSYFREVY